MTLIDIRIMARVLGALLPWRTIGHLLDDPCEAHAMRGEALDATKAVRVSLLGLALLTHALPAGSEVYKCPV